MNFLDGRSDFCNLMQYNIKYIYDCLKYNNKFSIEQKSLINNILDEIGKLILKNEDRSQIHGYCDNHLIEHLWTYKFLYKELGKIKDEVDTATGQFLFHHKISSSIQPILLNKIHAIEAACIRTRAMPIVYGMSFDALKTHIASKLSEDPDYIDTDTFHLSLDKCSKAELERIDVDSLEGSSELFGLLSWQEIIKQMPETETSKKILTAFEYAIRIAEKTYVGLKMKNQWSEDGMDYYKAWSKIAQPSSAHQSAFKLISVNQQTAIPHIAFTSDVAHDIKHVIEGLKAHEFCFFSLGTGSHAIVVHISCLSPRTKDSQGEYTYKIFNTGVGGDYHLYWSESPSCYIAPWIISNLNCDALSVEFFEKLVKYATSSEYTVKDFYDTHRQFLIDQGKGTLEEYSSFLYPTQNHGVCAYTSIEACIKSLVSHLELRKVEILKLNLSTNKQSKVVLKRKREIENLNESSYENLGPRRKRQKISMKKKKLKSSQKLLELTKKRFQEATKGSKDLINQLKLDEFKDNSSVILHDFRGV